jgi:hypothetical protein
MNIKNNVIREGAVVLILVGIVVFLCNPFHRWMPTMMMVTLVSGALVCFGFLASFLFHENASDEREVVNRMQAGRVAFLAGSATLLIGSIVQILRHDIDIWLAGSFVVMVVAKFLTNVYNDREL